VRHIFAVIVTIGLMAAVSAGCSSGMSSSTTPSRTSGGGPAPAFSVPSLNGGPDVRLAAYRGRPVIVNFWASWCGPCRAEMPALQRFAAAHPRIAVVGIASLDENGASRAFAKSVGATYTMGTNQDGTLLARFGGIALPVTAIIGPTGRLVTTINGQLGASDLATLARQLGV
jgi:cytochrome c biogenesis protein CcmG/thiol:disulfide interchange protein DsbE